MPSRQASTIAVAAGMVAILAAFLIACCVARGADYRASKIFERRYTYYGFPVELHWAFDEARRTGRVVQVTK